MGQKIKCYRHVVLVLPRNMRRTLNRGAEGIRKLIKKRSTLQNFTLQYLLSVLYVQHKCAHLTVKINCAVGLACLK